ncbi:MAG TPA: DUF2510 domain-containing protein [Candidatus Dormibacteraeota bacterium]
MTGATPPASWYEDPWHEAARRWWDGNAWTGHVAAAGSMLERETIAVTIDLPSRVCRLTDSQGSVIGSLDVGGSSPGPGPGTHATPQAGELMVATPGDLATPPGQPPWAAQQTAHQPSGPVPIRDLEGRTLFTLRVEQPGPSHTPAGVSLHGPDDTEAGRYELPSGKGQTVELRYGGQLVATIARDRASGGRRQVAVCGVDGAPLATVSPGDRTPASPAMTMTAALVAPLTGPVRYLVVIVPMAVISLAVGMIPFVPSMPMMPPMVAGTGPAMPSAADMSSRLMEVIIGRFFDSLGGG